MVAMITASLQALLCDNKTGLLSSSKLWLNIGYIAMTIVFLRQQNISWELLLTYGAVVAGNHVAIFWLKQKYGGKNTDKSV